MTSTDRLGVSVNPGLAYKAPVKVATTANITLSGLQAIDGYTTVEGDRVLVKDQTDQTTNGIYNASTGTWTRATDADDNTEVAQGMQCYVTGGSVNSNSIYALTTADPINLGTSLLVFQNFNANLPSSRTIATSAPLAGGGDLTGNRTLSISANGITYALFQQVAASSLVGNPTGSLANAEEITLGATLAFSGTALRTVAMTGDVTAAANSFATTIAAAAVTLAKMANLAANSIIGNNTGVSATPLALTVAQVKTLLAYASTDLSDAASLAYLTANIFTATQTINPAVNTTGLSIASFSLTGANAQSTLSIAGTWNTSGTPTALFVNMTDTASNAASLLLDLQKGGVSQFSVGKAGVVTSAGAATFAGLTSTASVTAAAASAHNFTGRSQITSPSDGNLTLMNAAGSAFTMLQWGGTSASFVGLKRSSTTLQTRLADDSAYAAFEASAIGVNTSALTSAFIAIAAGTTAKAQMNLAASTAPTAPNNGDVWFDGSAVKVQIGGSTKTVTVS